MRPPPARVGAREAPGSAVLQATPSRALPRGSPPRPERVTWSGERCSHGPGAGAGRQQQEPQPDAEFHLPGRRQSFCKSGVRGARAPPGGGGGARTAPCAFPARGAEGPERAGESGEAEQRPRAPPAAGFLLRGAGGGPTGRAPRREGSAPRPGMELQPGAPERGSPETAHSRPFPGRTARPSLLLATPGCVLRPRTTSRGGGCGGGGDRC